jgi:hypothetical protein
MNVSKYLDNSNVPGRWNKEFTMSIMLFLLAKATVRSYCHSCKNDCKNDCEKATAKSKSVLLVTKLRITKKQTFQGAICRFISYFSRLGDLKEFLCRKDGLLLRRLNLLHGKTPLIQ